MEFVQEQYDLTHPCRRVHELLLAYLRAADAPRWPGADSVTIQEVLQSYPLAAAAGLVPNLAELLEMHPELTDGLRDFFAAEQR